MTTDMQILNQAIHNAFHIGDKDECFSKHVGHTLSAIYVGNGYKNPVDYRSPSCNPDQDLTQQFEYWEAAEEVCKRIGKEKFRELASSNKFAESFDDYYIEMAEKFNNENDDEPILVVENGINHWYSSSEKMEELRGKKNPTIEKEKFNKENVMDMKTLKMIDDLSKENIQELINEVNVQLNQGGDMNKLFPSLSYSSLSSKCDYQMLQEMFDINPAILIVAGFYAECSIERLKIFNQFDTNLLTSMKEDSQCPDHTLEKISIILED